MRAPGPTVDAVIAEHSDLLTGVGPDTRSHYRGQLTRHVAPVLGPYPVAALGPVMPIAVVALDLAESVEPRERAAGLRVLEGLFIPFV